MKLFAPKPGDLIRAEDDMSDGVVCTWSEVSEGGRLKGDMEPVLVNDVFLVTGVIDTWPDEGTDAGKLLLITPTGGVRWAWRFQRWEKVA